jgi:TRAP-type C4-dicarboxylate transport system permease small subunit
VSLETVPRRPRTLVDWMFRAIEALLVLALAAMVCLVFGNVVLRYGFDSGILISEEISRVLFIWVTFLGGVLVMREGGHLGVDLVTAILPRAGQRTCRIVSDIAIIACCVLLAVGSYVQTLLNLGNAAPISGLPTGWSYAAGLVAGVAIGGIALFDLIRVAFGGEIEPSHVESTPT